MVNEGIGKAIKYFREQKHITQREFAEMLGFKNHSSIARIERGAQDVLVSTVEQMAKILQVSPAAFFFFPEDTSSEYLPYLADASEETLRTIRFMLHMPEKKTGSSSESIKTIS